MKKMNKKGFTLAELLIVLAIMAILIAIAIPVFSAQLENARHSVDENAARSAKSLAEAHYMLEHVGGDNNATSIKCTFSKDTNGNLEILKCYPTYPSTHVSGKACSLEGGSGDTIDPECTCTPSKYGKELVITVTNGEVSGGWNQTAP